MDAENEPHEKGEPLAAGITDGPGAERRREQRFLRTLPVTTQVVDCESKSDIGKTADGSTLDLTANSLRLLLNNAVPVDAQLDIWVGRASEDGEFHVAGIVRWVSAVTDGHQVGVELFEGELTQLNEWRAEIANWLSRTTPGS